MKVGTLIYDPSEDRFDILYAGEGQDRYGGLSCGTPMDVWFKGQWTPTRIEYAGAYSCAEIGRIFGESDKCIAARISRTRKYLKSRPELTVF